MAVRKVLELGDPRLREPARELRPDELGSPWLTGLVDDLVDTMRAADGTGIAAPQIGAPVRVFVVEIRKGESQSFRPPVPLRVLMNPTLRARSDKMFESYEGCLSIPGLRGLVTRFSEIEIQYLTETGDPVAERVWGIPAATFQHELDHLDGVLYLDRITDMRTLSSHAEFKRRHERPWLDRISSAIEHAGISRTSGVDPVTQPVETLHQRVGDGLD